MPNETDSTNKAEALRCPDCQAILKHRRSRTPNACEMVCGGCGQFFDVCDTDVRNTLEPPTD